MTDVPRPVAVKVSENFRRILEDIERFLVDADATRAYDDLLDELADGVIPNLGRFRDMGRPFLSRQPRSVEVSNALERLREQIAGQFSAPVTLREYDLADYLILYASIEGGVYLLAIRHHRQLSFDFASHWG